MTNRLAIINLVALTPDQLSDMPRLSELMRTGSCARLSPTFPAVTCTSQVSMLTGTDPASHGIVGNGWFDRTRQEVRFWHQSAHLIEAPMCWDRLRQRDADLTWANCFWWFAMYSGADVAVTPRPMYRADGRKAPDIWTDPPDLRDHLQDAHGRFPLFRFWGPAADITSSRWIADASRRVEARFDPTVLAVYLPHLDYGLQKFGPASPMMPALRGEIDTVVADLVDHFQSRGRRVLIVNEYGVMPVRESVKPNRALREAGMLSLRIEEGREYLDAGASLAFAVCDHQVAHVHVSSTASIDEVAALLTAVDGVDEVRVNGIAHERAGDLTLVAAQDRWFAHDWWVDPGRAPDYQRTVDIHRKPGYDPRELFIDPAMFAPRVRVALKVLAKRLGMRTLMDVIPLDTSLVRGSHGRCDAAYDPLIWSSSSMPWDDRVDMTDVPDCIESLVFD